MGSATPELDPLPRPDVPPGHVWPSPFARALLRELAELGPRAAPGEGAQVLGRAGRYALLSGPSLVFADATRGGLALREMARVTELSADLLPSPIALVLQPARRGSTCRLWMIRPRLLPLASAHERLAAPLARACAASLALFAQHGVVVEVGPGACALDGERVVALGLPTHLDAFDSRFVEALVGWVDGDSALARAFAIALSSELRGRLASGALGTPDLARLVARYAPTTPEGKVVRDALLGALPG